CWFISLQPKFIYIPSPVGAALQVQLGVVIGVADGAKVGLYAFPLVRKGVCIKSIRSKITISHSSHHMQLIVFVQGQSSFIEDIGNLVIRIVPMPIRGIMRG